MAIAKENNSTIIRSADKTWRKVTFSAIVPYRSSWVTEPIESSRSKGSLDADKFFEPFADDDSHTKKYFDSSWNYAKSQSSYFFSKRIKEAVKISQHTFYGSNNEKEVLKNAPGHGPQEPSQKNTGFGIPEKLTFLGSERREYDDGLGLVAGGEAFYYAVLHFRLNDATDAEVRESAEWLKRPGKAGSEYLTGLLKNIGIGRCSYSVGGFSGCFTKNKKSDVGSRKTDSEPSHNYKRIFVLTFAEVDPCELKYPSCFNHHQAWTPTQAWLYELATGGIGIYSGMPPSDTSDAAHDGMFCLDATWCRIEESGMALLTQSALYEEANCRHAAKLCRLCHSRMLDIIILCLRQRIYLDRNAESEARVLAGKSRWGDEEFDQLLDREQSVAAFLNGLWFTEVPGRREATLVMKEFQKVLGTPALLTELRDEQESLVRVVEVQRRIDNVAREKNRKEQERRREEQEKDAENKLEIIVLCLTVISTVLALAALFSDPSILLCIVGFVVAAILAATTTVVVREKQKSVTRNSEKEEK
ncbi:MAG: hypothetical protein E7J88_03930 [Cutibacterium granulosum]|nr:hypothetical protein [Cutibacterium granulosum]MDU7727834.1 hypothetical protein [Cutibacterium granulosum]